jgi:hypothetical protein
VWLYDLARIWAVRSGQHVILVSANDHVHARNSAHYADRAVDIQGTGLDDLAAWYRAFGLRVFWRVPGHLGHVHVEIEDVAPRCHQARQGC